MALRNVCKACGQYLAPQLPQLMALYSGVQASGGAAATAASGSRQQQQQQALLLDEDDVQQVHASIIHSWVLFHVSCLQGCVFEVDARWNSETLRPLPSASCPKKGRKVPSPKTIPLNPFTTFVWTP